LPLVFLGGKPLPVCSDLVTHFQNRINPSECPSLSHGYSLEILDERYTDQNAVFLNNVGEERTVLLIDLLHCQQRVSLSLAKISAL
jgi:hypothetical protein